MEETRCNVKAWKKQVGEGICSIADIKEKFQFCEEEAEALERIVSRYPMRITPYYLGLVDPKDRNDPIRKMCVPEAAEFLKGGSEDTSGEADNTVMQGMQHKYRQTVLILSTNQCAMYCRHCFRKRMVGYSGEEVAQQIPEMEEYVRSHTEINNVLISGGDAFLNSNEIIRRYLEHFSGIPTLDFIRFGTRVPVVFPQRIFEDEELLDLLRTYSKKKQLMIVTQFNHPRELTPEAGRAVRCLLESGCIIRNQTVFLKGVNDDAEILAELMNRLTGHGIIPYYVFQCRPVVGVKNQFQVPIMKGAEIISRARSKMNGQAKSFRYALSHPTGKIEIIGLDGSGEMIFKYHQAKEEKNQSRVFTQKLEEQQCWLDEEI